MSRLPLDAMGDVLAQVVREVAEETSTPVEMPAMLALGALSTAALGRAVVEMKHAWREHLGVWSVIIAESGERKSAVLRHIARPLRRFEAERREREKVALAKRRRIWTANRKRADRLEARVAAAEGAADVAAAEYELESWVEKIGADEEPIEYRLLVDDITPEALAGMLSRHPALGFLSDEAGPLDALSHTSTERLSRMDVYLKGYDGESLAVDRVGRDSEQVTEALIAYALCAQPVVAQAVLGDERLDRRGLLGRFLWCRPVSMIGFREDPEAPVLTEDAVQAWDAVLGAILALPMPRGPMTRPVMTFADEGAQLGLYGAEIEDELRPDGRLREIASWANKERGRAGRIAALLHLADGHGPSTPIDDEHVERAIVIGRWATEQALDAFGAARSITESTAGEQKVLRWLKRWQAEHLNGAGQPPLLKRELWIAVKGGSVPDVAALDYVLDRLRDDGWIDTHEIRPKGGGRPGLSIEIRPRLVEWDGRL